MSRGFGGLNTGGNDRSKPDDHVETIKWHKDYTQIRVHGDIIGYVQRWITIETPKGQVNIPKVALNYNPKTDSFDDTVKDPYTSIPNPRQDSKQYYFNAIVRDLVDEKPSKKKMKEPSKSERKSGHMDDKKSKSWTPNRVGRLPPQGAKMIQNIQSMNKHKIDGKVVECDPADEKYGCDLFISYDEKATPKYNIQKGEHTPLTKEEKDYLKWRIDELMKPESLAEAEKEAEALSSKSPIETDTEDDTTGDYGDDALGKKKKGKKGKDKDKGKSDKKGKSKDEPKSKDKDKGKSKDKAKDEPKPKDKGKKDKKTKRGI